MKFNFTGVEGKGKLGLDYLTEKVNWETIVQTYKTFVGHPPTETFETRMNNWQYSHVAEGTYTMGDAVKEIMTSVEAQNYALKKGLNYDPNPVVSANPTMEEVATVAKTSNVNQGFDEQTAWNKIVQAYRDYVGHPPTETFETRMNNWQYSHVANGIYTLADAITEIRTSIEAQNYKRKSGGLNMNWVYAGGATLAFVVLVGKNKLFGKKK